MTVNRLQHLLQRRSDLAAVVSVAIGLFGFDTPAFAAAPRTLEEKQVDDAIVHALVFLAREQEPSGCWRINTYGESTAATSLAVMAFLAAGHLPGEGPYGDVLLSGVDWVLNHQQPNGMLVHERSHGPMYSHGISTLMLAEVAGMLDEHRGERCRRAIEQAVKVILQAQQVRKPGNHAGGWRYNQTTTESDLSATGWQLLALRAAKNIGCDVPADHIDRAVEYVRKCHNFGGFAYQPGSGVTATRTGTGILCLEICGKHHTEEALAGAEHLLNRPLDWHESYFFYGVYYCSVGMFKVGGEYWEQTKIHLQALLADSQNADGSWTARRDSEKRLGDVYSTSLAVLALAVEYQYLPIYQR